MTQAAFIMPGLKGEGMDNACTSLTESHFWPYFVLSVKVNCRSFILFLVFLTISIFYIDVKYDVELACGAVRNTLLICIVLKGNKFSMGLSLIR